MIKVYLSLNLITLAYYINYCHFHLANQSMFKPFSSSLPSLMTGILCVSCPRFKVHFIIIRLGGEAVEEDLWEEPTPPLPFSH